MGNKHLNKYLSFTGVTCSKSVYKAREQRGGGGGSSRRWLGTWVLKDTWDIVRWRRPEVGEDRLSRGAARAKALRCARSFLCDSGRCDMIGGRVSQLSPQNSPGPHDICHPVWVETSVSGPARFHGSLWVTALSLRGQRHAVPGWGTPGFDSWAVSHQPHSLPVRLLPLLPLSQEGRLSSLRIASSPWRLRLTAALSFVGAGPDQASEPRSTAVEPWRVPCRAHCIFHLCVLNTLPSPMSGIWQALPTRLLIEYCAKKKRGGKEGEREKLIYFLKRKEIRCHSSGS